MTTTTKLHGIYKLWAAKCSRCGEAVWVMPANLATTIPLVCRPCADGLLAREGGVVLSASVAREKSATSN